MLRKRIRHLQRYREIVNAFARHGFGYIMKEMGLLELLSMPKRLFVDVEGDQKKHTKTTGERIRLFLEDLGPTFVKMGQIASTRYDLIPAEVIVELENLQDQAPHFSFEQVQQIIEEELGGETLDIFREFSEIPIAAASIGQVHYAVLKTGEKVAIKIQRPRMKEAIETDLEILQDLAFIAENRLDWAARYQIRDIVDEFSKSLREELDYTIEGRNAEKIAKQFVKDSKVLIPKVYWDYSTKKVLTMEYVEGVKLNEPSILKELGIDRKATAKKIVDSLLQQILIEGYFHGDPHPGNVLGMPGGGIIFLDFGMVGRLSPDMKHHIASLVIALMRKRTEDVIKAITHMGIVPETINMSVLRGDVAKLYDKYYDVPLSKVSLGQVVSDLFTVAYQHHIRVPAELTHLGKTLLTMEGMVTKLDPEMSILKVAEPFGRRLLLERLYPKNIAGSAWQQMIEAVDFFSDFPKSIKDIANLLKRGKLRQEILFPETDEVLTKLNRIGNRISFSVALLAFCILLSSLILGSAIVKKTSYILLNIPIIEIGFGVGILLFLGLFYSIFKSGKF